jgi:transcriptional regulator with XRE-family HTH domain
VISPEKKQKFSELLKYIRGNDGVKKFAARLEIKLPTYSGWETARAFPSDEMWEFLLPKLSELSGFTPELIERYLRGDYELADLIEGSVQDGLQPRARAVITMAKFRAWLEELTLTELIQILKDTGEQAGEFVSRLPKSGQSTNLPEQSGDEIFARNKREATPNSFEASPPITRGNAESLDNFQVNAIDQEAVVKIIFELAENLSFEKMVQVDNRLRDLIFSKLHNLGLLEMKKYQNNPFYILMEQYRVAQGLSYEQFEERLLREGTEAGLYPSRIAPIVRGNLLPDDRELLWMGIFIKKPDGSLYEHEELLMLRDGSSSPDSRDEVEPRASPESNTHHLGESEVDCRVNGKTFGLNGR